MCIFPHHLVWKILREMQPGEGINNRRASTTTWIIPHERWTTVPPKDYNKHPLDIRTKDLFKFKKKLKTFVYRLLRHGNTANQHGISNVMKLKIYWTKTWVPQSFDGSGTRQPRNTSTSTSPSTVVTLAAEREYLRSSYDHRAVN